jgi:uncharacterized protein YkwD
VKPRFRLIANVSIATLVLSSLAPGGVLAPATAGAAGDEQLAVLNEVNLARVSSGVRPVRLNDALARAATAHANYVALHPLFVAHDEFLGGTGFTGLTPADRARAAGYPTSDVGEVMAHCLPCALPLSAVRARDDVRAYLLTVYHRIGLLGPDVSEIGYGAVTANNVSANVIDFGYDWKAPANTWARWPAPGSSRAPTSWDGVESPNPAPGVPRPLGPAVTIAIAAADFVPIQPYVANVVAVGGSLTGPEGPVAVITEMTDEFASLLPKAPLRSATTYTVKFDLQIRGLPKVDNVDVHDRAHLQRAT